MNAYCLDCKKLTWMANKEYNHKGHRVKHTPSQRQLEKWAFDSICKTPDGCKTEPDGGCLHGFSSWLMIMGII